MIRFNKAKTIGIIGLSLLFLLMFSGCWGMKEPKSLAVIQSVIYDLGEDQNYRVILELLDPSGSGGGSQDTQGSAQKTSRTFVSESQSIPEGVSSEAVSIDNKLFAGHNKVRFFSEAFALADMSGVLDFFIRDHLTDETPYMVVIRDDAPEKIYHCSIGLSDNVGDYIDALAGNQSKQQSCSVFVNALEFSRAYYQDGIEPVAGLVQIVKNPLAAQNGLQSSSAPQDELVYEGLAAFRENRLVGYFDATETRSYNFITNNVKTALISLPVNDSMTVFKIDKSKSQITTKSEGGQVSLSVCVSIELDLIQESGTLDISKYDVQETIQKPLNALLKGQLTAAIQKAQTQFHSDIFGFGSALHRQDPEAWNELKNSWNDAFSDAEVSVSVKTAILRTGEIKEPLNLEEIRS